MGAPLSTEVIEGGELPAVAEKAFADGAKAAEKFRTRIHAYAANQNASTFAAMEKAFGRFMAKTVSDDPIGAALLASEFGSIRDEWAAAFERLHAGESVDISSLWPMVPKEATKRRNANPDL
jgi:hypothetical protein